MDDKFKIEIPQLVDIQIVIKPKEWGKPLDLNNDISITLEKVKDSELVYYHPQDIMPDLITRPFHFHRMVIKIDDSEIEKGIMALKRAIDEME